MSEMAVDELRCFFAGQLPLDQITPEMFTRIA